MERPRQVVDRDDRDLADVHEVLRPDDGGQPLPHPRLRDDVHHDLSVDLDVLDPSIAPGTGTPEAGGATYRELLACLHSLAGMRVVAMDLNETAPPLDPTGMTAATAAKLTREMILLYGMG